MVNSRLKHTYSILFAFTWRPMLLAACSKLCDRESAGAGEFARSARSSLYIYIHTYIFIYICVCVCVNLQHSLYLTLLYSSNTSLQILFFYPVKIITEFFFRRSIHHVENKKSSPSTCLELVYHHSSNENVGGGPISSGLIFPKSNVNWYSYK